MHTKTHQIVLCNTSHTRTDHILHYSTSHTFKHLNIAQITLHHFTHTQTYHILQHRTLLTLKTHDIVKYSTPHTFRHIRQYNTAHHTHLNLYYIVLQYIKHLIYHIVQYSTSHIHRYIIQYNTKHHKHLNISHSIVQQIMHTLSRSYSTIHISELNNSASCTIRYITWILHHITYLDKSHSKIQPIIYTQTNYIVQYSPSHIIRNIIQCNTAHQIHLGTKLITVKYSECYSIYNIFVLIICKIYIKFGMHPFVCLCIHHVSKQKLITPQPVDLEKISRCQNNRLGLLLQIRCAKVAPPPPMVVKIGTKQII